MRYRLMGSSGLRVSELALGAMTFGNDEWGADKDESRRIYDGFRDAGGNFVDTANRAEHRARLDEVSATRLPFPHDMIRPFRPANVLTHRPDQH